MSRRVGLNSVNSGHPRQAGRPLSVRNERVQRSTLIGSTQALPGLPRSLADMDVNTQSEANRDNILPTDKVELRPDLLGFD